jgi:hypothetical protein
MMMNRGMLFYFTLLFTILSSIAMGQSNLVDSVLELRVPHFELANQSLFDGLSRLSGEPIALHLGFEEVLKQRDSDAAEREPRFSMKLENVSVRDILDGLCNRDARYKWSLDGSTINVYPRAVESDPSYLLNLRVASVDLKNVTDSYAALTPIARRLPTEQIGYRHLGAGVQYSSPWSVSFENLTVRQLVNRITAHLGPQGGWIFSGSKENRWFTFHNSNFERLRKSGE